MTAIHTLFVIPGEAFSELTALYEQWSNALRKLQDDVQVIQNQLYRQADALAVARVNLAGDAVHGGILAVARYVRAKVWKALPSTLLTPENCHELSRVLRELRERVSNEDVLMRRMLRYRLFGDVELHHVREGWHALCHALDQAVALEAGLLWVSYEEGAEEKLEAKRRADALAREEAARAPKLSPEERDRQLRELQAELDRMVERGREMAWAAEIEHERERARTTQRTLYAVPAEHLDALRAQRPRGRAGLARVQAYDEDVARQALASARFDTPGARGALEVILQILHIHTYPRGTWAVDIHDPARAADLERALIDWTRGGRGSEQSAIEVIAAAAHGVDDALSAEAYHGVRELLCTAREHGAGVIVVTRVLRE